MLRRTIASVLLLSLFLPALRAQDSQPTQDGKIVRQVNFIGAPNTDARDLALKIKTSVGKPFKRDVLNDDIRSLVQDLKIFADVSARTVDFEDGIKVDFYVTENPRIVGIIFTGIIHFDREELLEVMDTREGGLADEITLQLDVQRIREKYLKDGYHFAQVGYERRQEPSGTSVGFLITEGDEVDIEEIRFIGVKSFDEGDLLDVMPKIGGGNFLFSEEYVESEVNADVIQLQQFYYGHGFLDAQVTLVDRSFNAGKDEVYLTLQVEEGEPYVIRSISFKGLELFDEETVRAAMQSLVGERYEPYFKLAKDTSELTKKYHDEARINARVRDASIVSYEGHEVDVVIEIEEGALTVTGNVHFTGNVETKDKVIRRLLDDLAPGTPLNQNTLNRARQRLISLQYFERETFEVVKPTIGLDDYEIYKNAYISVEDTERENVKDILINLEEKDTGSLRFAVGVGSNAGVVGSIQYTKENFDPFDFPESFDDILDAFTGGGQRLVLLVAPGTEQSQFSGTYFHPFIFDTDYEFSTSAYHRIFLRENWDETRTGFNLGIGRRFGFNISATLRYRFEFVTVDDIDSDAGQIVFDFAGQNLISSAILGFQFSDLEFDEVSFQPIEGYRFRPTYEFAGLGGDISFNKVDVDAEYYQTLFKDADNRAHVLYFDGRIGFVEEAGDTRDVPIYERFFAGGHGSVRGFDFRGIGPHTRGSPDGGKALITGSLNYIAPIYERILAGVLFLDTGTLAPDFGHDDITKFRVSVGFGIRLTVPFLGPTPFALDFGFPLIKFDGDETQLISFSLERTF